MVKGKEKKEEVFSVQVVRKLCFHATELVRCQYISCSEVCCWNGNGDFLFFSVRAVSALCGVHISGKAKRH